MRAEKKDMKKIYGEGDIEIALDKACRRIMRTCPNKCPIIIRACYNLETYKCL